MNTRGWRIENGGWTTRSVLECGSPLPLSQGDEHPAVDQSVRGLAHSKTWRMVLACFFLHSAFCLRVLGQSYSIDWSTIDGGGGTSTGGVYSVSGTIGQPDAGGPMTGGNFSLTGGFWSLYAVQTPGAPLLSITRSGNSVIVSWPMPSTGFLLEETPNLNPPSWTTNNVAPSDNGTIKAVTVPTGPGNRFYRLKR